MKLIIFRSSKGDCLLISHPAADDNKNNHILVDGGKRNSFRDSVAPYLNSEITAKGEEIDLLCVSHIDDDHIDGVLALMDLLADWRVFRYHQEMGNDNFDRPELAEPPNIKAIWHNSFARTYELGSSLPRVEQALHDIEQMTMQHLDDHLLEHVHGKATSIRQGITLSQMIRPEQLGIELNPPFRGRLVKCNQRFRNRNIHNVGQMQITILGPFTSDLNDLRDDWRAWERRNRSTLAEFYSELNLTALNHPFESSELRELLINSGSIATSLGARNEVSIPNLASIMFLVEADGHSILMTGDGHSDDIIKGLRRNRRLSDNDSIHVDVLKIQHHGAEANIDEEFCRQITADHYVFCGNGTHENPEEIVIDVIFNSRRGTAEQKSLNDEVDNPFTFWFSANPHDDLTHHQEEHLTLLAEKMEALKDGSNGQGFDFNFMPTDEEFMEIDFS